MEFTTERRGEKRLRYHWPVWFAEDFNGLLSQGQMVDVSSVGAAFTCSSNYSCPYPGQTVTTRFSVPKFDGDNSFNIASFTRHSVVRRIDTINAFTKRVAVQFAEPLSFKPAQQAEDETQCGEML
ncbi:MAG TPA: hypothetical protein PLP05_11270, partial [Sedimentisphaerales bacterium]|nr:hypothetical protein [Sedimentisphaerales bacterium]